MTAAAMKRKVTQFFRKYAQRFERSLKESSDVDTDAVVDSFADYFVAASPAGVHGGRTA